MKKWLTILAAAAFAAVAAHRAAAEPTLRLSLDRNRIYLGESVVARVALEDGGQNPPAPRFEGGSPASIDYRGPQSVSSSYITIVNGRRQSVLESSTTFTFVITPSESGVFETGRPTLSLNGHRLSCPSEQVRVMAPGNLDFVTATLSCPEKSVLVDGRFRIIATISVRALPEPNGDFEPILPRRPLAISAAYLDFPETDGLKPPSADEALGPLAAQNASLPFLTINGYQSSAIDFGFGGLGGFPSFGSPFRDNPVHFRPAPERVEEGGTNWWRYTFPVEYLATAEGDYSFGPLTLKGAVVTGANPDGTPVMSDLYVLASAVEVRVSPPPEEGRPAWYSGAVGRSMSAKATLDAVRCKVGDPLTLTLDITGDVSAAAIRPPDIAAQPDMPPSFRIYGDHVESESIDGGKRFKYRLRPLEAGTLEFPAIPTAYYDSTKGEYATVSTDPIPLQVDATTQIAISAAGDDAGDGRILPDGIVFAAADDLSIPLPFGMGALDAESLAALWPRWLMLPPGVFLLLLSLRRLAAAFLRWRHATRHRRAARRARRRYAGAMRRGRPAEALAAARTLAAAVLGEDTPSLTAAEFRERAASRGLDTAASGALANAIDALEAETFRSGATQGLAPAAPTAARESLRGMPLHGLAPCAPAQGREGLRGMSLFLLAILLLAASMLVPPAHVSLQRPPDAFEWERAQGAMAAARTPDDFSAAARLYAEMADAGAATGPLCHNLGVALLMSGEPRSAARALDRAARWRGAVPELVNNRAAAQRAIAAEDRDATSTPPLLPRIVPPVQWRVAAAAAAWALLWLALVVRLLVGIGRARLRPRSPAAAMLAALLSIGASTAGAAQPAQISVHAYARPERIYAGQDFEVCFDITLPQASNLSLGRPSGIPADLEFGTPFGEGVVGDGQDGRGVVIRAVMPAFFARPLSVSPSGSAMELGLVERTQTFFGISTRTVSRTVPVRWEPFEVLPLPDEGRPEGFSGAVGQFSLSSRFSPRSLAVGDIARWELSLSGKGRLNGAAIAPPTLDAALFRTYSAEPPPAADGVVAAVARTVVPLSTQAVEVAGATFDYFDPVSGRYERAEAPPVALEVRERAPGEAVTVKTIDLATPGAEAVTTSAAPTVTLRLAPAETAMATRHVAADALETLEEAPGGWRRVRDPHTGHTGWVRQ